MQSFWPLQGEKPQTCPYIRFRQVTCLQTSASREGSLEQWALTQTHFTSVPIKRCFLFFKHFSRALRVERKILSTGPCPCPLQSRKRDTVQTLSLPQHTSEHRASNSPAVTHSKAGQPVQGLSFNGTPRKPNTDKNLRDMVTPGAFVFLSPVPQLLVEAAAPCRVETTHTEPPQAGNNVPTAGTGCLNSFLLNAGTGSPCQLTLCWLLRAEQQQFLNCEPYPPLCVCVIQLGTANAPQNTQSATHSGCLGRQRRGWLWLNNLRAACRVSAARGRNMTIPSITYW